MMNWKKEIKYIITQSNFLKKLVYQFAGDFPRIFVYHRFSDINEMVSGRVNADIFGWQLDQMKNYGQVMTVADCIEYYLDNGKWPSRAVIVTVDDGYRDFYRFAFPELKKRNLSATFYTTVNFIDHKIWLWPDRLDAALKTKDTFSFLVDAHGQKLELEFSSEAEKMDTWQQLSDLCVSLPDHLRRAVITQVEDVFSMTTSEFPPVEYEACNWTELCEMAKSGIEIGSHTMNHPILSKIPEGQLEEEILFSKKKLEQEIGQEVKTFCYPNSRPNDINQKVIDTVQHARYLGAVFGDYLHSWEPFCLPRMGSENDKTNFIWKLCGGEKLTQKTS